MNNEAFSLIGDALLAITESNVYRGNDDTAHADDALAFAVSLLVEARDLLRAPAVEAAQAACRYPGCTLGSHTGPHNGQYAAQP